MPQANRDSEIIRGAWASPESFATTLLMLFVDAYGTDGFQWHPETIQMEIEEDFRLKLPPANFDRLMTAINLITGDDFYKSLPDFIMYCNVLSGDTYDPRTWDPADAAEIAWGITEGLLINPPDERDDSPFTDEIVAYIGHALNAEGIMTPPDVLKIAVRDNDPEAFVAGQYSDDPLMFDSIYDLEQSKTAEINQLIVANIQRLASQLESLPIRSGSTSGAVQQMLQGLQRVSSEQSETLI